MSVIFRDHSAALTGPVLGGNVAAAWVRPAHSVRPLESVPLPVRCATSARTRGLFSPHRYGLTVPG